MIKDHTYFLENVDLYAGKNIIQGAYYLTEERECDIAAEDGHKKVIKDDMIQKFRKQMIKDLSGYFNDSLTDADMEYLTTMSHTKLQKIRQLDEFTKYMSAEQIQKILSVYAMLVDLGFASKENND